ncbi:hypothetical protein [Cohnella abietis]|uniref:Lipoprotein n=1 Tax=Cohnella abietis TaxID=2507935 RepID=A0A3T1DEE2_9BACL|nr:hypothetical protein [Cohnella abietis]BBI36477.1 hypothetical protein KCTCHS21_58760 [Cohnella abietis]
MNKKNYAYLTIALIALLLISACGTKSNSESPNVTETKQSDDTNTQPPKTSQENGNTKDDSVNADEEILIIIDQTPKPIEGNSFDFLVNKRPEGYSLTEMQWISDKSKVINTIAEAVEHGGNGGDGFYISGDGQFSGFFYPDTMKKEKGQIIFIFKNDQGKELTWKKELTLN